MGHYQRPTLASDVPVTRFSRRLYMGDVPRVRRRRTRYAQRARLTAEWRWKRGRRKDHVVGSSSNSGRTWQGDGASSVLAVSVTFNILPAWISLLLLLTIIQLRLRGSTNARKTLRSHHSQIRHDCRVMRPRIFFLLLKLQTSLSHRIFFCLLLTFTKLQPHLATTADSFFDW